MEKLRNWFCDSDSESDNEISSEEEETEDVDDWEAVNRKKKNKMKKEKKKIKIEKYKADTAVKASRIVGIGPITKGSIKHFEKLINDYEKAKLAAVREYLQFYLNYEEDEIEELDIQGTQCAKDDLVYIVIPQQSNIRELYSRIAKSNNRDIVTRNFIPPQYYERFMHISRMCKARREADSSLKTQMRFGKNDIEVLVKMKGSEEPYKNIPIKEICRVDGKLDYIPEFDDKLKWHKRNDKPPRRPQTGSPTKGKPPSTWLEGETLERRHHLSRTSSQNTAPKKRLRNVGENAGKNIDDNADNQNMDEDMVDEDEDECL